jgi:hypothetical protein
VADHAAEALVALKDREALPQVSELLDQPDPCLPFLDKEKKPVVAQLVAVNHLRNCLLCHAPSTNDSDMCRGAVPTPGRSLSPRYYTDAGTIFVRADVTYLQQDFSAIQPVTETAPWPEMQRFDYLIRNRPLTAEERADLEAASSVRQVQDSFPQKEAALFVLRELTGEDRGRTTAAWRGLFIKKDSENRPTVSSSP